MTLSTNDPGAPVTRAPGSSGRASRPIQTALLVAPAAAAILLFFALPLVSIVARSFTDPTVGIQNYVAVFTSPTVLTVLGRTVLLALIVVVIVAILAVPYTYVMAHAGPVARVVMITVILVPFWTSMMARNYSWLVLMQKGGLIESAFAFVGIPDVVLLGSLTGVGVVMVQVLLPFMVLPLYTVMQQIDSRVMDAAQSLGASRSAAFRRVYLPLSVPGLIAGGSLVFIFVLGFYITPALIGSPQQSLIAQYISVQTRQLLDFGGAGALGVIVLVITLLVLGASQLLNRRGAGSSIVSASGVTQTTPTPKGRS